MSMESWLTEPYSGYQRKHDAREDAEITHVGPGTPGGEYLRRVWQPVCLSSEVQELPKVVRLLGEDLVIFRTKRGRIGLLEKHCSHRGASLEFGLASDEGIVCCYHGWHYAVDGRILETPNDPASKLRSQLCHGAYPVIEYRGIVFAYMGPPAERPEFPHLDTFDEPENEMVPFSLYYPCNWLQVFENTQDPVHSVFLHTRVSGVQFSESWGEIPVIDWVRTPLGMMNVNVRRWKDKVWWRTTETILPNLNQAGALWEPAEEEKVFIRVSLTRWMRPIDDTHTLIIGWRHFNDGVDPDHMGDRSKIGKDMIDFVGQVEDRPYEEAQRYPGDFEAIVSQRPIALHAREALSSTDRGVALLRRLLRENIRAIQAEKPYTAPRRNGQPAIPTYTQDTIVALPLSNEKDDRALLRDTGEAFHKGLLESAKLPMQERPARLAELARTIVATHRS